MDFYRKQFAKRLVSIMEDLGVSQSWLAEQIGVEASTVHRWVKAKDMPTTKARISALAGILGVDEAYLLGSEERKSTLVHDREAIRTLIESPDKTPLSTLSRLLQEFQSASPEIRAATLAIFFYDPQIAQPYLRSGKALKSPKG